jgi:hypothetical protein
LLPRVDGIPIAANDPPRQAGISCAAGAAFFNAWRTEPEACHRSAFLDKTEADGRASHAQQPLVATKSLDKPSPRAKTSRMSDTLGNASPRSWWNPNGRLIVFALAFSSIACLLCDFYQLCPMRAFTLYIFAPALVVLAALAVADRLRGDRQLWNAVLIGVLGGLVAAIAYDVFRLPFVFAKQWGLDGVVPPMPLFKVFPRFGAMILGEPIEQPSYSLAAHLIGWAYHFSNGCTFGVMYLALVGDGLRRHWGWAVLMAVGLELGMLFTPYPQTFGIHVTARFVVVTMAAHLIFGIVLGRSAKWMTRFGAFLPKTLAPG